MEKLRPDDHFLILLEGDETPMHIGSLLVLDVPDGQRDDAADRLRAHLIDRLPATPLLRRLHRAPLGFDSDVWLRADDVDIDAHIVVHRRERPFTDEDLHRFVEEQVMRRLDLAAPPFSIQILDPVEGGRLAMYVRVHHCVADGVGFQTVLGLLSDDEAELDVAAAELSDELADRHQWLADSVRAFRAQRAGEPARQATRRAAIAALRDPTLQRPETPTLTLSGPTSARRAYTRLTFPFDEMQRAAKALTATLNDLFLALAGTAMRNHLIEIDDLPGLALTTNSARSYRRREHGAFGNRIVAIHPHLATNEADPIDRLRAIQESMALERRRTVYDEALLNQPETPFGPLVRRRRFAERRGSGGSILPGNITVSNVPGPARVRTYAGFRQVSNHPTPLLGSGRALNFTARRNGASFDVGVMADPTKIADVEHIATLLRDAFGSYEALSRKAASGRPSADDMATDRAQLRERWYREGFFSRDTIVDHLRHGAAAFPNAAMHFVGGPSPQSMRLGEMYERSTRVAGGLANLGIGPGDVVAIWVPNWLEGALAYQGALMLGATVVPIIHIYGPHEVGFILRQSRARVLIMPHHWRTIDYGERFASIVDIPDVEHVVCIGGDGPPGAIAWATVASAAPLASLPGTPPDERCLLLYTSGTTADPKGVQHTTNTLVAEIRTTAAAVGDRAGTNLAAFPAGHIAGVLGLFRMFLLGVSTVSMDVWDPALAARLVPEHGITSTAGAPFYLASLMDEAERQQTDLTSLSNFMVGAANVPASLVERADRAGITVYRAYGSTEHPVITTGTSADPLEKRAGTDGRLTPGNEIRLLDDDGHEVGVGRDGEIVSRGPELFIGYTDPVLDADSFLPGGWFRTGDIGRLDADGYLTITDRKKDVIIRGGENIASKEVEDLLARHPAVIEAAVVGQPDERYGERVAAFVLLRPGASLDLDEVGRHFAAIGVARQKTPEHLHVVDEMPRTPTGKVRKVELRNRLRMAD